MYARERVIQAGQPAIVLRHQLVEERRSLVGGRAGEFRPRGGGMRTAGDDRLAVADFEHAAEEIEDVGVGLQTGYGHGFPHCLAGLRIELGE